MFTSRGLVNQSISIQQNTVQLSKWVCKTVYIVCYFLLKKVVVGIISLSYAEGNSRNSQKNSNRSYLDGRKQVDKRQGGEKTFQGRPFSVFEK